MEDIIYPLADILEASISVVPKLGNAPNLLLILALFGFSVYWIMQLQKFNKNEEF